MKKTFVTLLLLLSFFLNISHASIIANQEQCIQESTHEYLLEMDQSAECGDFCDMHHLFHLSAIIVPAIPFTPNVRYTDRPYSELLTYSPLHKKSESKPPIA